MRSKYKNQHPTTSNLFVVSFRILVLLSSMILVACSYVDNYMLGKDNTPKPKDLQPIKSMVKLHPKWSYSLNIKSSEQLKLKPTIVGNIIYLADASGLVEAHNKNSGKLIWSQKLTQGIVSSPSVANHYIALSTDNSNIVLLKQENGEKLWQSKVSSEVLSKPLILQNKVIAKTIDGNLYALDLSTGKTLWISEHGAPSLILKASSAPVVLQNLVLVGYSDGKMDALDLQTGRLVWQRSITYANGVSDVERLVDIDADPIIRNNIAYLASYQGYVGALSLSNGEFLWRRPASVYKNMILDHGSLYLVDSDDVIWSLDQKNGQVNWKQVALKARGLTEPTILGKNLILGDKTGLIHVLSLANGQLIARKQLDGAVTVAPIKSAGNNIYVMTSSKLHKTQLNNLTVG